MKNKVWLVCIFLLAAINIFLFWPGSLYFLNDDLLHIPLTDQGHLFQTNSVRPIHELLVRLDLLLWDKQAYGYHITALILHAIVCIQLYDLCFAMQVKWLKISFPQAKQAAFLAVVLFLAYPQSSESLAWILGRTPVLSAIFFMITVRLFFAESYRWPIYFAAAFLFAATLFTYEQSILLPIALLLIAFFEKEKAMKSKKLLFIFILAAVDAVYIIVRKLITSEVVGAYEGGNLLTNNWRALAANAFRISFRLILNPAYKAAFIWSVIVFLLFVIVITYLSRKAVLNKNAAAFFATIIVLLIAPVISLGVAVNSFESGRYLYLPSIFFIIGISIVAVSAANKYPHLKRVSIAFTILLVAYWLWGKQQASRDYFDASSYAKSVEKQVQEHFTNTSNTLYMDTLRVTIKGLPVFRLGFKTGAKWLDNNVDTNKIIVKNYYDGF